MPLHPGGASDSWGRREPGRGGRGRPRLQPRAGRARLGVGGRAGGGRGVPRPSPCVPAALGRMTQQPKQRQEEAAGEGGEEREGRAGSGGGRWEGRTGGGGARGGGRAPPCPTSLTSDRPAGRGARGRLRGVRAGGPGDPAGKGIPEAPSSDGRPALGVGGPPRSRQPVSGLVPVPCHIG